MKHPLSFEDLNARLHEKMKSPEYQADLQWLLEECQRLENLAQIFLCRIPELSQICEKETVRIEYATGSTLRRGFYCPSPVFELIVGNTKRGKLCSRKPARAKHWYMYGFDSNNKLLWCQDYYNGSLSYTEYLIYEENHTYGIQVEARSDRISHFTDESYENGRLTNLLFGRFLTDDKCRDLHSETYQYNDEGIVTCTWHSILIPQKNPPDFLAQLACSLPQDPIISRDHYTFYREEGLVCGYSRGDHYYKIQKPTKI